MIEPSDPALNSRVAGAAESSGQWRIIDPLTLNGVRSIHDPLLDWARQTGLAAVHGDLEVRQQSLGLARLLSAIDAEETSLAPRLALALHVALKHPAAEASARAAIAEALRAAGVTIDAHAIQAALTSARALTVLDARDLLPVAGHLLNERGIAVPEFPRFPTVEIGYPRAWHAPVNPHASAVEAEVERSFHELGLLRSTSGRQLFRDLAVAEYGGWACPTASPTGLKTVMTFLALWIFHDDALEGLGARAPGVLADAVAGALPLDDPACDDAFVRGWALLGHRLRRRMSPTWLARHRRHFLAWVDSVGGEEAHLLRLFRRVGRPPRTDEYLEARRVTIGMVPTLGLIEYVLGIELPERIVESPAFAAFGGAAADAMAIHNDIFGLSKDSSSETVNLVACRARELRSLLSALEDLAQTHASAISRMVEQEKILLDEAGPDRDLVSSWLRGAGQLVCGLARWHAIAPRYSDLHRLADGKLVRIAISPC